MVRAIFPVNLLSPNSLPHRTDRLRHQGLTLVVSSRFRNAQLAKTLRHYVARSGLKAGQIEVRVFINPGIHGLSVLYNQALKQAHFDVVCFLHDDLSFLRGARWGLQVLKAFQSTDFAVFSAAGSVSLGDTGVFWEHREHLVGRVRHRVASRLPAERTYFSTYSEAFDVPLPALVLDGLFLAVHRQRVYHAQPFDERFTFHFYDLAFSLRQSLARFGSCAVLTRLQVVHHSLGQPNAAYWTLREAFVKAYHQRLPAFLSPEPLPSKGSLSFPSFSVSSGVLPRLHSIALHDLSSKLASKLWHTLAEVAPEDGVWIYDIGLDPVSTPLMLKRLWHQFLQGQGEHLHSKIGVLAPRLHYADTHLLFHQGLAFSEAGIVHLGMHQPYAYSLQHTAVDAVLACGVLVRGDVLRAAIRAGITARMAARVLALGNDDALAWGLRLSAQAHAMGLNVQVSGSAWGLWYKDTL